MEKQLKSIITSGNIFPISMWDNITIEGGNNTPSHIANIKDAIEDLYLWRTNNFDSGNDSTYPYVRRGQDLDDALRELENSFIPVATINELGGICLYGDSEPSGTKNYKVQLGTLNKAYVNVPWENTTYSNATTTASGLMSAADKRSINLFNEMLPSSDSTISSKYLPSYVDDIVNVISIGSSVPSSAIGSIGDYYANTDDGNLYIKGSNNQWVIDRALNKGVIYHYVDPPAGAVTTINSMFRWTGSDLIEIPEIVDETTIARDIADGLFTNNSSLSSAILEQYPNSIDKDSPLGKAILEVSTTSNIRFNEDFSDGMGPLLDALCDKVSISLPASIPGIEKPNSSYTGDTGETATINDRSEANFKHYIISKSLITKNLIYIKSSGTVGLPAVIYLDSAGKIIKVDPVILSMVNGMYCLVPAATVTIIINSTSSIAPQVSNVTIKNIVIADN